MKAALVVLLLLCPTTVEAQERPLFDFSPPTRHQADVASDWLVGAQLAIETVHSLRSEQRWKALGCQGLRAGAVLGATEGLKRLAHRTRPDGSDRYSFPSGHTGFAFSQGGWRASYTFAIGGSTGAGRMAASKHYPTDVLAGALLGLGAQFICRGR